MSAADALLWSSTCGPRFQMVATTCDEVVAKIKATYPAKRLRFEEMTDQINVYSQHPNSGREALWMTVMP